MRRTKHRLMVLAGCASALGALAQPASAQTVQPDGRTTYDAAYFQTYAPSNALDIVQRVPGFVLESGDQDVRGFGQAAGNLVINGQRPSSKSDSLQTILSRIPASRVVRVEIGPGDLFGSEYSGKPQVVNLILSDVDGLAGTLDASVQRNFTGRWTPEATVSLLYRTGASTFNAALEYDNFYQVEEGFDRLSTLPDDREIEFRRKVNVIRSHGPLLTGSWAYNGGDNRTINVNFRLADGRFALDQTNDVYPAAGPVRDDGLVDRDHSRQYELGGDITRPLLGGGLKLLGLATRRSNRAGTSVFNRITGNTVGGFEQTQRSIRDERIVRLVWSRSNLSNWSVETGVEGAFNRLDSDVDLFSIDAGNGRTRIDLPVDEVVVRERRGEAFVNVGRALASTLRLDTGLTYETSRLTVSGDTMAERTLSFWKPKATLDWRPGGGWHAQFTAARTVAQLNFGDFVSAAELTSDRVNGGNTELVPQRAWELLATIERPILGDGLAKVELGYQHISLVQDRVPTPEGFDAPGNLGTGKVRFVRGSLDAPLARFGITGGRLTVNGMLRETSVRDPYTGQNRRFSNFSRWQMEARFRQDLGQFAWGVSYFGFPPNIVFRQDEIDRADGAEPFIVLFGEYRPNRRATFTVSLENLADVSFNRRRTFFAPDRRTPTPGTLEYRERAAHTTLTLNFKFNLG